jgi:hypothetical protein
LGAPIPKVLIFMFKVLEVHESPTKSYGLQNNISICFYGKVEAIR